MLKSDKRGISIIIGYVILVSMAIGLSVLVYNWVIHYVPSEDVAECPEGTSLSVFNVRCQMISHTLNFSVKNTGLFSVDGFVAKVNDKDTVGIFLLNRSDEELLPGDEKNYVNGYLDVSLGGVSSDLKLLELQSFMNVEGEDSFCQPSVKVRLDCSLEPEVCYDGVDNDLDGDTDCDDLECRFDSVCSAASSNPNLFLHLLFEMPNPLEDSSDNDNEGVLYGGGVYNAGGGYNGSGAYVFNGSNCIVDENPTLPTGNEVTIGAWIYPASYPVPEYNGIIGWGLKDWVISSPAFAVKDDGELIFYNWISGGGNTITSSGSNIVLNGWNHVVATVKDREVKFYVNGSFTDSGLLADSLNMANSDDLTVGCMFFNSSINMTAFYFDGTVDEVRVYDYAMSDSEVGDMFNSYV